MEKTREAEQTHWDAKFSSLENMARDEAGQWARVERELMSLKAELPVLYTDRLQPVHSPRHIPLLRAFS